MMDQFGTEWSLEEPIDEEPFGITSPLTEEEVERLLETANRSRTIPALRWLAAKMNMEPDTLASILDRVRSTPSQMYRVITLGKRGGGTRTIHIPAEELKDVQRRINKHILGGLWPAKNVFGFWRGDIGKAIQPHLQAKSILLVDFRGAFPTITDDQIIDFLTEGRQVWYFGREVTFRRGFMSWYAARIVAQLTTYQGRLPQGAPSSPKLFDLICRRTDDKLLALAERIGGNYTRYADNIFFSMPQEDFPTPVKNAVLRRIRRDGFVPHKIKVRRMERGSLRLLGLNVIEQRVHNTRGFKRALRLSIHHVEWLTEHNQRDTPEFQKAWRRLRGQMAFARIDTLSQKLLNAYLELETQLV